MASILDKLIAQTESWNAMNKQTAMDELTARIMTAKIEQMKYEMATREVSGSGYTRGGSMQHEIALFTVYKVTNGFYAKLPSGAVTVGATLSECCTAAQGQVAEEVITGENEKEPENKLWTKV